MLDFYLHQEPLSGLYYELPAIMGHVASSKQDIIKLTTISGTIAGAFSARFGIMAEPVRIVDWKGQVKKPQIKKRVLRKLKARGQSLTTTKTHEFDSIGIGLYVLGEF